MADFEVNKRLKKIIDEVYNISPFAFSQKYNDKGGVKTSQVLRLRNGLSSNLLNLITEAYPDINRNWLLTGEGEPLLSDIEQVASSFIPLLPVSAIGGSLQNWSQSVRLSDCEQVISPVCDVEFAMTVAGESMAPKYPSGCRIFCKKINEKAFIEWGKVYVIDTCNGPVIKVCNQSHNPDNIRCSSLNVDQVRYQPFDIPKAEIYSMYRILANMSID